MKKFLAILLVFLLVLSTFVACNSGNGGETEKPTDEQTEKDTEKDTEKGTEKQTENSGNNSGNSNTGNNNNNNTGNENTGDNTGDSTPKAYRFGMTQANVDASKIFYLTGEMSSYYMATTDNMSEALNVYLEATEGGYYLYCMIDDVKTYINMVVNDTHVNGAYEATASTVYTLDEENGTLKANVTVAADETKSGEYWFGTRNDMNYTTVGPVLVKYEGFFCKLYDAANTEDAPVQQPEDDNTGDDNTGDTPACEHVDANTDYKCDKECGTIMAPAADSVLTSAQATTLGSLYANNAYTSDSYTVSGVITSIDDAFSEQYGNITVTIDGVLKIYRLADGIDGETNECSTLAVGDTITVYGTIGKYSDKPQMKTVKLTAVVAHEHAYENGACTICGAADPNYVDPCTHVDANTDYECDNECGTIMPPVADSVLTSAQATTLGSLYANNAYTSDSYTVSGVITSIDDAFSEQYGNITVTIDGVLKIYRLADGIDGETNECSTLAVGDTITVYGTIGKYSDKPQMKTVKLTAVVAHEHAYENGACTICGAADPDNDNTGDTPACEHVDANNDYSCDNACGTIMPPVADSVLTSAQATTLGSLYANNAYTSDSYTVSGVITSIDDAFSEQYGNITVTIDGVLKIYRLADGIDGETNECSTLAVGDTITVYGTIGKYSDKPQMKTVKLTAVVPHEHNFEAGACTICGAADPDSETPDVPEEVVITPIADALKAADNTEVTVSGIVVEIKSAWSEQYGNMEVVIADEAGDTLHLYRTTVNCQIGDLITVTGKMDTHSGARQLAQGSTGEIGVATNMHKAVYEYIQISTMQTYFKGDAERYLIVEPAKYAATIVWTNADGETVTEFNITQTDVLQEVVFKLSITVGDATFTKDITITVEAKAKEGLNTLATFEFGENVDVSAIEDETKKHSDGSAIAAGETFESGAYNLVIDSAENVYSNANDKTGLSCLKLGTSKKTATLSFTVGADVKQVVIKIAKYKANTTKISVNGGEAQSLTKNSDNGEYDEIIIDTTTNKTVTIATVTGGVRAMINSITFNG